MKSGFVARSVRTLGPRMMGAVYVWIILIVIFSVMEPSTFANSGTAKLILNQNAETGLVALGLLLPLSAGLYDLSVGSVVGLSGITTAWVLANVTTNVWLAIGAGLAAAALVGLVNSFIILVLGVNSFIGTLASSSIVAAVVTAMSGQNSITKNVTGAFQNLALENIAGITLPVILMFAVMLILGYVMEHTAFGRYAYATGFDREVARLGGVRIATISMVSLVACSLLAGLAGIAETSTIGAGSDTIGPSYLLPAFAAAFLGATQFRAGRFNPWGTVVAVLLLGTGNVGLLIIGAPAWAPGIFDGAMLIVAVALTSGTGVAPWRNLARRGRRPTSSSARGNAGALAESRPDNESGPASLATEPVSRNQ